MIAPKHLSVVFMAVAALIVSIGGLPRISSSYAQTQQDSSGRSTPSQQATPVPASLQVSVLYPPDGTVSPNKPQVVRAAVIIGPPQGVSPHKYLVVERLSNSRGDLVRSHAYHPADTQSVGQISMRHLLPGDYMFSAELQYAGTLVAQSGSSKIKKTGRAIPKGSTTPTPTPTATTGATPVPGYSTTWYGNSFGGSVNGRGPYGDFFVSPDTAPGPAVQTGMADMTVTPAGLVIGNINWSEGHRSGGLYQNGQAIGVLPCEVAHGTNWGGFAVTNNGTYIYYSTWDRGANFVNRYAINGAVSTFSGGGGDCGNQITVDGSGATWPIYGLAASSTELYVSDALTNSIKIYDANTMAYKRAFTVTNPRRIAYDPNGSSLWVSTGSTAVNEPTDDEVFIGNVYHYDLNGNLLSGTITDAARPRALLVYNSQLYVGDAGPDQQIKIYNNTGGAHVGTFGAQGGMISGTPGVWAANKLHKPAGIGFDSSNNIYVAAGTDGWWTDTDLRAFNSGGTLLWHLEGQQYVDGGVIDDASDGQDVYTQWDHDKFDYGKLTTGLGGGGTEWSFYAKNADRYDYPYDLRGGLTQAIGIRTIGGIKYLATSNMFGQHIELFHMVNPQTGGPGEIAKPMMILQSKGYSNNSDYIPNKPGGIYLWSDTNNNGIPDAGEFAADPPYLVQDATCSWDFDDDGDIWWVNHGSDNGVARMPRTGTNSNGQLTYGSVVFYGTPPGFTTTWRSRYDPATDALYVTGYTGAYPPATNEANSMAGGANTLGRVVSRYSGFLAYWAANGTWPSPAWTTVLPYNIPASGYNNGVAMRQMAIAGSKMFFAEEESEFNGNHVPYAGPMTGNIWVYDSTTGALLGQMNPYVEADFLGWQDANMELNAFQRANGEYVVTEEEQVSGHVTVLRGMLSNFTQY